MKYFLILTTSVLLATSCGNDTDEISDVDWLEPMIAELAQSSTADYNYVLKASYNGRPVFIFSNCCPFCNSLPAQVYSGEGEFLGYMGDTIAAADVSNEVVYWQTDNGKCVFDDLGESS